MKEKVAGAAVALAVVFGLHPLVALVQAQVVSAAPLPSEFQDNTTYLG